MAVVENFDLSALDQILDHTLRGIETSREQIYEIAEMSRNEYRRIQQELKIVKLKVTDSIQLVDNLEIQSKGSRLRLMEVSRNFNRYQEEEIKSAYERAQDFQIKLALAREWETQLRKKRDELELSLKNLELTVEKAENLINQISLIVDYLQGSLTQLSSKMETLQQRQQMGLQIIKAQEEERRRVAREVHDGPAQSLANIVLRLEVCQRLLDTDLSKAREELKDMKVQVRASLQDVRRIIFDLRPMVLDDLGLVPAIRRYLEEYKKRFAIDTNFVFHGREERIKSVLEVAIFRIMQEALTNVYKHSGASRVSVQLKTRPNRITLVVEDDGRGFDVEQAFSSASNSESYGLISMRERAELFGGSVVFQSNFHQGTKVISRFNLND